MPVILTTASIILGYVLGKESATIPYDLFIQAGKNWDKYHNIPSEHQDTPHWTDHPTFPEGLTEFLDFDARNKAEWFEGRSISRKVVVPEHTLRKWQLLAGPHYHAILRAYEVLQKAKTQATKVEAAP